MKLYRLLAFLLCFAFGVSFAAQTPDPMKTLNSVADRMLASLKRNRPRLKRNPRLIYRLVEKILLPHVDTRGMSRSALGRNAWKSASSAQRRAFTREFTDVVIGTYASALNAYKDERIEFYPIRGGYQGKRRVFVRSKIIRSDGPPIPLSYRLILMGGRWKVYDLNVEGVGLLQSFRAQFADELSQGKSVTQITSELRQRNREQQQ